MENDTIIQLTEEQLREIFREEVEKLKLWILELSKKRQDARGLIHQG